MAMVYTGSALLVRFRVRDPYSLVDFDYSCVSGDGSPMAMMTTMALPICVTGLTLCFFAIGYYMHRCYSQRSNPHQIVVESDGVSLQELRRAQRHRQQELNTRQNRLETLPTLSHAELCATRRQSQIELGEECAICLCEYEAEDMIRVLPCKHHFHKECIDAWFKSRLFSERSFCPLCKGDALGVGNPEPENHQCH